MTGDAEVEVASPSSERHRGGVEQVPSPREAVLVVNAHSRRGEKLFQAARDKLVAAGVTLTEAHAVHDPDDLVPTVRSAIVGGAPMVIVGGGDGSLSSTIDEFVGRKSVFALLPLGTANSFARTLAIPLDLDGAVHTIASGKIRRLDLGVINGDYFANAAALGLSPLIGETVPHRLKRYLGRIGYLLWAIWCLTHFRPFRLYVGEGDDRQSFWATEVRVFNGRFHGGVEMLENEALDDGEIVVQAVTGRSVSRLGWDWLLRFFKLSRRAQAVQEFRGSRILLDTKPHLKISIDGEVVTKTPAVIESAHRVISVIVPGSSDM
ncbi:MAG: YegS/Rv2252/BmrU family lipid kinase [Novosphingobium sp.]|nr:MAG: YegS/Rv2252/BmrU family lipid kinase [Novosphingobium sp.]